MESKDIKKTKDLALGLVAMVVTFAALWASMWIISWMQ